TPRPAEGLIDLPLAHDPDDRRRIVVSRNGLQSQTRYRVMSSRNGYSVLECELITGRTHQIRVHLAARGWPIVGDHLYGTVDPEIPRQPLQAWRRGLPPPISRDPLQFEAVLPPDLADLVGPINS